VLLGSRLLQRLGLPLVVLCLGLSGTTPASAQSTPDQLLFGPQQYLRTTGPPNQYTHTFTVPSSIGAPFLLRIVNGDADEDDGKDEDRDKDADKDRKNDKEKDRDEAGTLRVGKLAHARAGHTATLLADGTVLLTGGRDKHRDILDSAEVFDPTTLQSALLGTPLTTPRAEQTGTLLPSAETLLAGGRDRYGVLFSAELFQRDQTFGVLAASLQIPRAGHTATLLSDGRVLLLGGLDVSKLPLLPGEAFKVPSGVLYDPRAGSFTLLPHALTVPRSEHTATLLPSGLVLVVGGRNEDGVLGSAELFDPETGTSTLLSSTLATPRASHTASLLNDGRVLIAGGKSSKKVLASVEVFDPASQTFMKQRPNLRRARVNHTATVLPTGEILIAGGQEDDDKEATADTELYVQPGRDSAPPTVLDTQPASSATGVSRTTLIGIRFSEPINVTTLTASSLTLGGPGGPVAGTISPGEQGLLLFVVPGAPLAAGTTYTLSLTSDITDTSGNPLTPFTSQFTTVAAPTITSFTPNNGPPGTAVTITGTNFDPVASKNEVKFNGVIATVTAASATSLTALVPGGATTGPITVTTRGGTATSATNFTVITGPVITGFTPTSGRVGDTVTVSGTNFVNVSSVTFDGGAASFTVTSPTLLTAVVPVGATSGPIRVTTAQGTATSPTPFTVIAPPPTISGFTPSQGKAGANVIITGQNFDAVPANNQVRFAGVSASLISATSSTLIATVPPGAMTGLISVTTAGGTVQSATAFTVVPITAFSVTPALATLPIGESQQVRAIATFADQTTLDVTSFTTWVSSNPNVFSVTGGGLAQGVAQGTATITGTLGGLGGSGSVQVVANDGSGPLPPDPSSVAPSLDSTVVTTVGDATAFLYTGANPIQTGVAPGTIVTQRAAVLRGLVRGRDGFPIPGVTVTILNHPEFGQTLTRPDGMFDLAVNGGGPLTVNYAKNGLLSAQRQVNVPWQDYVAVPDVVMIALDPQVTAVTLTGATAIQVARGSAVTDADGTRQATLLFAPGTQATMVLPGGGTQPLTTMSVRATEYTVGTTGPQAMPALLPPNSLYTYAVSYSVDEAMNAGATSVQFTQPVIAYVENFLGLPVGTTIPSGAYDRSQGVWVGSGNGRIIKILSVTGGVANVDTDGDGAADNGLSMTTAELQQLGALYQPGTSLWRVPVTHFTEYDYNFGPGFPPGAVPPGLPFAHAVPRVPNQCEITQASVIGCQNQTLGETVALTGTPFALHYQSDRVPGRLAADALEIPLSGASVPGPLKRIDLEVAVAGRRFAQSFPPLPNQSFTFQWDGKDAYERTLQGSPTYQVSVGYVYDLVYSSTQRWGANGSTPPLTPQQRRIEATQWQRRVIAPTRWDARAAGLGGWSLNVHHAYDPVAHALYLGTGGQREADTLPRVITTVLAGAGTRPNQLAAGPDGSVYIASRETNRVWRLAPSGAVSTVAGTDTAGFSGDGGPATAAQLSDPTGVALGPDGSVYVADTQNHRVRRVDSAGLITTVAGTGVAGFSGDNGPASLAQLNAPRGVAVGPDSSVYIADTLNQRIRRLGADGIITTYAGTGSFSYSGDGGPALAATMRDPQQLAVAPDGSLYIAEITNAMVRRVGVDGLIRAVTRNGFLCPANFYPGDGGPASGATTGGNGVAVGPDGTVYVAGLFGAGGFCDRGEVRVYQIDPRGIITTVAGTGVFGFSGDGGPATAALLGNPGGVAVSPDGSLYIADNSNTRTRRVAPSLPGLAASDFLIAAEDGTELYVFNSAGKHLRTLDALTGAVKYQFTYDSSGLLASVADVAGQVTTVERDGSGNPTAIVAPGGQRTTLAVEANGYLASVANPAGDTVVLTYTADGLLATQTNPRGVTAQYTYDGQGLLTRDANPAGGFSALARTESATSFTVSLTSALGRTRSYFTDNLTTGARHQINTDAAGLSTNMVINPDGSQTVTAPDGTVTTTVQGPDPRFGMQAPITKSLSVKLPTGLTSTLTTSRTAALSNPADPLSLTSQTDTLVINGRTYTSVFNQTAKTITTTTPAGRTSTVTLDAQGRVITEQVTGLESVSYTYDALGRLATITQGTGATARTSTLSYDTKNLLTSILDPLNRTVGFSYDLAGRITSQTLPDTRTIGYSYDANGNVTSITPPGRPTHAFDYTPVDLESDYNPPDAGFTPRNTQYTYNLDRQLTLVTRPDGQTLGLGYDTGGRLSTLTLPGSLTITYAYDPTKGTLSTITAVDGGTLAYTYDGSLLKQTTWAGTVAGSVARTYDANFRIITQSVNGANTITFGYENDSLLTSAGAETITRSSQNGLITGTTLGVVADSRSYSTFGELGSYTATANSATVFDVQYTRDKLGRITQKVETIGGNTDTFEYTYDTAGRLTDVTKNGTVVSHYVYDINGNRLSLTDSTGTVSGTYDAQDRLTNYGNLQYTYTANGELQTKTNPVLGQSATFSYDVLGNLTAATLPNGTQISYVIDGQNRRIGKKLNGTLAQGFLYQNQLNPVAELDGTGAVVSRFVYGTKANVPDYMTKSGVTYRIVSDHLGSPRLVIDTSTGTVAQRMDYDEFGNVLLDTNPGFHPFGFAGGLYDQHTGLTRFGARDYDAQVGRWTAKDPIRFLAGNTNLYGYALNDPVNGLDPSGLDVWFFGLQSSAFLGPFDKPGRGVGKEVTIGLAFDWNTLSSHKFQTVGIADPKNPSDRVYGFNFGLGIAFGNFKGCFQEFLGEANEKTVGAILPLSVTEFTSSGKPGWSVSIGKGQIYSFTDITTYTVPNWEPSPVWKR